MSLYELTEKWNHLQRLAEDPDVDAELIADTAEAIEGEFEDKAEACVQVMKNLQAEAEMYKKEAAAFTAKQKAAENGAERLKRYIEACMIRAELPKVKTNLYSLWIQKNAPSLVLREGLDVEAEVPEEYIKRGKPTVNSEAVKEAIKNGAQFDWATVEQKESIRIK